MSARGGPLGIGPPHPRAVKLCKRLAARAAKIVESVTVGTGLGSDGDSYFQPYYVVACANSKPPKRIDEDKLMADTLAQMGNVVIPVSLKLAPSKSVTALETAIRAELTANLELNPEQLASRLRVKGFKAEDVQPLMGDQFYVARREAMYERILRETSAEKLSAQQLEERILPTTDKTLNSPIRRLLTEQFDRVNALRVVEKFALPLPKTGPRALATGA